ncbi:MAG: hypothetical protein H6627_10735 [Calditrichae bacterium]|nr:hypothetical protein [Calditrichia bacterium]
MDHSIPKSIRRKLREFSTEAYERELKIHLKKLNLLFKDWEGNKISSGELNHRIYEYNQGVSKKLFAKYNTLDADVLVGFAVANGVLVEEEIPADLYPFIERSIKLSQALKEEE